MTADPKGRTVADVGEGELLRLIAERTSRPGPGEVWAGDDTAVLGGSNERTLWAADALVEGVDFDLSYCTGYDIGWKTVAVNVSDIAAMGGRPLHALATMFVPPSTELAFFNDVLEGLLAACENWELSLVGGDLSAAPQVALSMAVSGAPVARPVLRSAGTVGEVICVTGSLGGAAGGLQVLQKGARDSAPTLVERQLRPHARVEEGTALATLGVGGMIDVSDGLLLDLSRLLRASEVGCEVTTDLVPVDPHLEGHVDSPLQAALGGGEDFELLFTIDPEKSERAGALLAGLGTPVTEIGVVTDGAALVDGRPLDSWKERGWDHLKGR